MKKHLITYGYKLLKENVHAWAKTEKRNDFVKTVSRPIDTDGGLVSLLTDHARHR